MFPKHEHRLPSLTIQLLEQHQRLLLQPQTSFLISMHDIQCVLSPIVVDLVALKRHGEHFVARVFYADAEGFEDFDVVLFFLAVRPGC